MGFESGPPNDFRASLRSGGRAAPVVAAKPKRADRKSGALRDVKVARSESRISNQRGGDRHRLCEERATVRRKGKTYAVELINLSHGGAMVAGDFKAKLWDKVELLLGEDDNTGAIECAVRWIRGDRIGLEFAHETRVECDSRTLDELLRQVIHNSFPGAEVKAPDAVAEKPEQRRADERHPMIWNGILHHDYEWEIVRLRNISANGAQIECAVTLPAGVTVYLDLEGAGRVGADVSWSRGSQCGLAFHEPFDVRSLAKLKPAVAERHGSRPDFGGDGKSDQSPWAPEWSRLSVGQLGAKLGE